MYTYVHHATAYISMELRFDMASYFVFFFPILFSAALDRAKTKTANNDTSKLGTRRVKLEFLSEFRCGVAPFGL